VIGEEQVLFGYFIARAGAAVEKLPLHFVRHVDLVAAVRQPAGGARTTPAQMLEFKAVLAAASKRATILPLRFGTSFRNEAAVTQLLAARAGELGAALERLDDRVEMTVRVRLEQGQSAARRAAEIGNRVEPLETWSEVRTDRAGQRVVELAHLLSRSQAAEYRRRLAGEGFEVSGPWPPVHFLPQFLRLPVRRATGSGTSRASGAESAGGR
jgi:gas vesicle protein GvpL/GvpF